MGNQAWSDRVGNRSVSDRRRRVIKVLLHLSFREIQVHWNPTIISGGNLAAVLAIKAAQLQPPIPLVFQLLIVPVTDNTASVETYGSWAENQLTPWLSPDRMLWFRNNYLPNQEDWTKWDASPFLAPDDLVSKLPKKAWIGVTELDILRDEGIQYGAKLSKVGIEVEIDLYKGAPHRIMIMDGRSFIYIWDNS